MIFNKNNNLVTLAILILLNCVLFTYQIYASSGKIRGIVYDKETEETLAGANVIVESIWEFGKIVNIEEKQGAASDLNGNFFIMNVPPGTYNIIASMIGYKSLVLQKVRVNVDRTITVDFALEPSVVEMEAVQVVAKREVIRADVAGTQEIITTDRITEAPILRVDEFIGKIKGVEIVADEDGHGLSIRGGGVRETDVRVDGISIRDPRSGNAYLSMNSTSIEELQVLSGGFEAKHGGFRSGLANVVTKEGQRDKYSISLKIDYARENQKNFFGTNPWSNESWVYRVYADTSANGFAMTGTVGDTTVPEQLRYFKGWKNMREGTKNYEVIGLDKLTKLTAEQKRQLWLLQHPQYSVANKPDVFIEGTITGPIPGKKIPVLGSILGKSTFMLGGKYENTQFAFPIGPRDKYLDWNSQLKITSKLSSKTKLSINCLYAKVETNTSSRPSELGGALLDYSSRFSFLTSTGESIKQQARILGSSEGFVNMFNKSRLQYLDQQWLIGGVRLNQTLSPKVFFTLDLDFSYQNNEINPFAADPLKDESWAWLDTSIKVLNFPEIGSPNASTNSANDISNLFSIYGGVQQVDSSYYWTISTKGDLTAQIGLNHQVETGFTFKYNHLFIYSGTWYQTEKLYTPGVPDTWQYYTATPLELGVYLQDKLEFEGMVACVGVRADYFNPQKKYYEVRHPLDEDYSNFYNVIYESLPGKWGSYERWEVFREMLDDPAGWPAKENKTQLKISPRVAVSFPVTVNSKLYFNYGHYYQSPSTSFLYNLAITGDEAIVPSTQLNMAKNIEYEFGYEQQFFKNFLFNTSLYYKDVKNEPLACTYIDFWDEFRVSQYVSDAYADIRGIELRLEKRFGRFFSFWGNCEYRLKSSGKTGLRYVYENRVTATEEKRTPNINTIEPVPLAHLSVNLHTPKEWGLRILGLKPLSGIFVNFLCDWEDGGKIVIYEDAITGEQQKTDIVDDFNLDLRASKSFNIHGTDIEFVITVTNLLNQKKLFTDGMSTAQYNYYKESLHFPFEEGDQKGNDKWGEWDKEHIDIGWFQAPLFLNPRRVLIGLRITF